MPAKPHRWTFPARFRARSFGPYSSRLACQRIREAVSEIRRVARRNPVLGGEGAVRFAQKLAPAVEQVDASSGALGTAATRAVDELVGLIAKAPADARTRSDWLDRLFDALQEDGFGYLDVLSDRWGEVCASSPLASEWADRLMPLVRRAWSDPTPGATFAGTTAALSSLLTSQRYDELLGLLDHAPRRRWAYRQYGVRALVALGRRGAALRYAEATRGPNQPDSRIDRACESILLASGMFEEAFRRYGLTAHLKPSRLATFREVVRTYPMLQAEDILKRLIDATPGEEGKWFATAKELGYLDLALKLVEHSPTDPRTLWRATRDYLEREPAFAHGTALACLRWIAEGHGDELTSYEAVRAWEMALEAGERLGLEEETREAIRRLVAADTAAVDWMRRVLGERLAE